MICRKCIYCNKISKRVDEVTCKKFKGDINEPCYCRFFTTEKEYIKTKIKKEK